MKPKVLISKCLGFDYCRYNGAMIAFDLLDKMEGIIDFIPVCPEVEIGLGVPRESLRLIENNEKIDLVQPHTQRYLTEEMETYAKNIAQKHSDIDGLILKGRSPSCGIKDVKVYSGMEKSPVIGKSQGIFAKGMAEGFPHLLSLIHI